MATLITNEEKNICDPLISCVDNNNVLMIFSTEEQQTNNLQINDSKTQNEEFELNEDSKLDNDEKKLIGDIHQLLLQSLNSNTIINMNKHEKYYDKYVKDDIFYGLGIENECYFVFDECVQVTGEFIKQNTKRERYSIDYFTNFKQSELNIFFENIKDSDTFYIPVFMNSHTLTKCDINGEHRTIYNKNNDSNPKFNNISIFDGMLKKNNTIKKMYLKEFVFDGDSFEIITQNFYNTTVNDCVKELLFSKKNIEREFNKYFEEEKIIYNKYGKFVFQDHNYGIVMYLTNMDNIGICNNGTYHINITLPTKLNNEKMIDDYNKFCCDHKKLIKCIQWVEPLLIACYGSPDIFSIHNDKFAKGSLRVILSRYISIGMYNTNIMTAGKILDKCEYKNNKKLWYTRYHENSGYNCPLTIGSDINFNKFKNHGIEIRFFDFFPEEHLIDIINFLVLLGQFSLHNYISNPLKKNIWHDTIIHIMKNGYSAVLNKKFTQLLFNAFCFNSSNYNNLSSLQILQMLSDALYNKYKNDEYVKLISPNMKKPFFVNYNRTMNNINKIIFNTYSVRDD
jgi:hypothetical protein